MKTILKTEFGSKIYGTSVPTSDTDYKSIFIPDGKDLILQRAPKHLQQNTKSDQTKKNDSSDVDHEMFSIQSYCKLLAESQTPCLDVLFSPKEFHVIEESEFGLIYENKSIFLNKSVTAMLGYTKQQAAKYGIKGFRVSAVKESLDYISQFEKFDKLHHHWAKIQHFVRDLNNEHVKIIELNNKNTESVEPAIEICNRKYSWHKPVREVIGSLTEIYSEYGHRAKMAEENRGVDWKAMYHAVRVSFQTEELLLTHQITFPRPEAKLLLNIRRGDLPYKQVAEIIENRMLETDSWVAKSTLPEIPDYQKIEELVYHFHKEAIVDVL